MPNFTGLLRAPLLNFEVHLTRKETLNACQNARARVEYVKASDDKDAKKKALALPHLAAYRVSSVRKI
jgi:hypothetical protein